MRRRTFLGGLAGGVAGLAGCLGGGTRITGKNVEHVEPRRSREQRPTIVEFDDANRAVNILGYMAYGSSSCNRVGIASTDYQAESNSLRVVMTSKKQNPLEFACTADMAFTWYRATVRFAGGLPQEVTVVEGEGDAAETRTVDRTEQEALCTTDHPPDSAEGKRAHWTCPERYLAV